MHCVLLLTCNSFRFTFLVAKCNCLLIRLAGRKATSVFRTGADVTRLNLLLLVHGQA